MSEDFTTKIKVFGVGGAGCNAINRMVTDGVTNVEFYAVNLDQAVLDVSKAPNIIALGKLGAGGIPAVGKKAAEDHVEDLKKALNGANMVFITAGLGGGTGTGAAPVIARLAHEQGSLTVGVVTKPFTFEGKKRMMNALAGLDELRQYVDSIIVISNDKLLETIGDVPIVDSFKEADSILRQAVQTITDLIAVPLQVNLDFNDISSVMKGQGNALIGIGMDEGEDKAVKASMNAIRSPLLEAQISGAKNAIVNVTGGASVTLRDAQEVVATIRKESGTDLDVIFGLAINEKLGDKIIVTVIATGFDSNPTGTAPSAPVENYSSPKTTKEDTVVDSPEVFRFRD